MAKPTHVNIELDALTNDTLTASAKRNNRSKRKEAQVRLIDHLRRFDEFGMAPKAAKKTD